MPCRLGTQCDQGMALGDTRAALVPLTAAGAAWSPGTGPLPATLLGFAGNLRRPWRRSPLGAAGSGPAEARQGSGDGPPPARIGSDRFDPACGDLACRKTENVRLRRSGIGTVAARGNPLCAYAVRQTPKAGHDGKSAQRGV